MIHHSGGQSTLRHVPATSGTRIQVFFDRSIRYPTGYQAPLSLVGGAITRTRSSFVWGGSTSDNRC